jgi:hypothetical protein
MQGKILVISQRHVPSALGTLRPVELAEILMPVSIASGTLRPEVLAEILMLVSFASLQRLARSAGQL